MLKSQEMQEKSAGVRLHHAELRRDTQTMDEIFQELKKIEDRKHKWRLQLYEMAKKCRNETKEN